MSWGKQLPGINPSHSLRFDVGKGDALSKGAQTPTFDNMHILQVARLRGVDVGGPACGRRLTRAPRAGSRS